MERLDLKVQVPHYGSFVLEYPVKSLKTETKKDKTGNDCDYIIITYGAFSRKFCFGSEEHLNEALTVIKNLPQEK